MEKLRLIFLCILCSCQISAIFALDRDRDRDQDQPPANMNQQAVQWYEKQNFQTGFALQYSPFLQPCKNMRRSVRLHDARHRFIQFYMQFDRDQLIKVLNRFQNSQNQLSPQIKTIAIQTDLPLLIEELLNYHHKIITTPNWRQKFKDLKKIYSDETNSIPGDDLIFHLFGFPRPKNVCYQIYISSEILTESRTSLESWLYSFWYRRYHEGNMQTVHLLLKNLQKRLATGSMRDGSN